MYRLSWSSYDCLLFLVSQVKWPLSRRTFDPEWSHYLVSDGILRPESRSHVFPFCLYHFFPGRSLHHLALWSGQQEGRRSFDDLLSVRLEATHVEVHNWTSMVMIMIVGQELVLICVSATIAGFINSEASKSYTKLCSIRTVNSELYDNNLNHQLERLIEKLAADQRPISLYCHDIFPYTNVSALEFLESTSMVVFLLFSTFEWGNNSDWLTTILRIRCNNFWMNDWISRHLWVTNKLA